MWQEREREREREDGAWDGRWDGWNGCPGCTNDDGGESSPERAVCSSFHKPPVCISLHT